MMLSNYGKVDPHMTVTLPQCVRLSPKHNSLLTMEHKSYFGEGTNRQLEFYSKW